MLGLKLIHLSKIGLWKPHVHAADIHDGDFECNPLSAVCVIYQQVAHWCDGVMGHKKAIIDESVYKGYRICTLGCIDFVSAKGLRYVLVFHGGIQHSRFYHINA